MRSFSWWPLLLFLIPAAILQKQSKNTLSSALCSSSYLRKEKSGLSVQLNHILRYQDKVQSLVSSSFYWKLGKVLCVMCNRWVMLTCQSCNRVWSVPPGSSSSPVHQRTGMGWCAADPAARWGWSAQTGCWSGPTTWPADLCLQSAAGCPAKEKTVMVLIRQKKLCQTLM